jgi:nucleoid DNA-binding protein
VFCLFGRDESLVMPHPRQRHKLSSFVVNLTKRELTIRISNEIGLGQKLVDRVIQRTMDHITETLAQGQTVELRDFGVFKVKRSKERVGRNPNRPEIEVKIPPRLTVKFKTSKLLKSKVQKLSQQMA